MRIRLLCGSAALVSLLAARPATGQASDALYARWSGLTGVELQSFAFNPGIDSGFALKSARQFVVPVVVKSLVFPEVRASRAELVER